MLDHFIPPAVPAPAPIEANQMQRSGGKDVS